MSASSRQNAILFIVLAAAFAAAVSLSSYVQNHRVVMTESYADEDLDLQGKRLKGYALGSEGLLADWYWIRSLQYVGDKILNADVKTINLDDLRELNPRLLYPMLDNATDLDPKFITAYLYGAIVLPAIDPAQAIALTEKGIANNPDEWRLYQCLGYIHWRLKNYEKAAEVYKRGSQIKGAPAFFKLMAGLMENQGGSRETARSIYGQIYRDAEDEQTRKTAGVRLQWLDSLDERDLLNSALSNFKGRNGRCARNLAEIYPMLDSSKSSRNELKVNRSNEVVDPTGVPYQLDSGSCQVLLSANSKLPKD